MKVYSLPIVYKGCIFRTKLCIHVSQEAGKIVWYSHLFKNFPLFVVIHTVKGFSIVSDAEVGVFLEFSCFFYDRMDVGNLISGSSACSKSSLYIWKLLVRVLLKPSLKDFKLTLYPLLSLLACETGLSQGLALLGLSVLSYHVLIFR